MVELKIVPFKLGVYYIFIYVYFCTNTEYLALYYSHY